MLLCSGGEEAGSLGISTTIPLVEGVEPLAEHESTGRHKELTQRRQSTIIHRHTLFCHKDSFRAGAGQYSPTPADHMHLGNNATPSGNSWHLILAGFRHGPEEQAGHPKARIRGLHVHRRSPTMKSNSTNNQAASYQLAKPWKSLGKASPRLTALDLIRFWSSGTRLCSWLHPS